MKNIDTEKLIRAYNRLPEVYKKILQFKALFLAENKNEFLNCIRSAGIKTESDKVFTHSHLKMVFSIFENEGLLEDGKFLNLALRHYIAKETVQDQSYEKRIIEEDQLLNVEKVIKHDSTADIIKNYNNKRVEAMPEHFFLRYDFVKKQETVFSQSLYLAVYENNSNFFKKYFIADEEGETDDKNDIDSSFQDIAKKMSGMSYAPKSKKIIDLFNTFIKLFNNADFDDDKWFEERNNYIKLLFSFTKFSSIMGLTRIRQANFGYWLDLYKNNEGLHQIYLDKVIVNYFVDLDLALGIFSKKKYEKMYGEEAETLFISGIEKFINGNFAEAKSSLINTMNKQRKKEGAGFTNKSIAVKFLILIYLSDSKTMRKAKTEINKLRRNFDDLYKEINYWDILLELQEGNYQYAKNYFFNLKLSVSELKDDIGNLLLYIILEYLLNEERVKKSLSQYVGKFKVYRDEGLVLHAHIMAELILKFQDNNNCRHFLENVTPYKKLRFLSLFRKKDFWEYKFEILTKLISDKKKTDKSSTVEQNRVIWKLDVDELFITPVEQKVLKNGNWSKGKRIALSRLYNKDSKLVYFTEEDWKIARCVKKYSGGYYHNAEYSFNHSDALEAMIGHSLVFNEDNGLNIEIVKGNIEVIIKENKDGYKITLSNYHYKPEPILVRETETRYKLINFDDNAVEAADLLTKKGLNVPLEKKEQIEEIQKNLKGKYALRSNIENIDLPTLNPSTCMILHFIPINRGLKINLWVRPFDNKGPYLRPGHGEKIQTFLSEGNNNKKLGTRYKVIRNLKEERKNADTVIENIQVLQETNANNDEWIFEDLQDCLELLEQVKKYKEEHSLLIEWPKGESLNLKQTVSYKNMSLKLRTKNDWFEFDGDIKLDDGGIVKLKYLLDNFNSPEGRFIKLSEGKFLGLTEKFRKHIEELKFVAEKNKVHKLGSRVLQNFQNEGAKTEVDKQWTEHIEKLNKLEKHNPRIPGTLAADLRDYQKDGYKFLSRLAHWGVGGCLADDMGLGKTVQSIALLLEKAKHGPSLVVAPTSVCFTWIDEISRFAPTLNIHYFAESSNRVQLIKSLKKMDVLICSYGLMQINNDDLAAKKWQLILMDEAQAIKNPTTKRWKAAVSLNAATRFALTGTPIENHLGELWSIFRFLNPGQLGSLQSFQKKFINPIENDRNTQEKRILKNLMSPFILRRIKTDVLEELPPKTEQNIFIESSDEEKTFYEACRQKAVENIENISETDNKNKRFNMLAEITKLRQACCHSSLVNKNVEIENSKIKTFLQTVVKLKDNNHRALVFSQYVRFLNMIKRLLDKNHITYQYIDGSTKPNDRKKAVERFQTGKSDIFLLSLKAGGTGLNLTAADYVIHLDPWWNPAVEDQASDRAHRIGQQRPVTIYRLIMKNTIEEKIIHLHNEKRGLAEDILEGTDTASRINEDELLKLIRS